MFSLEAPLAGGSAKTSSSRKIGRAGVLIASLATVAVVAFYATDLGAAISNSVSAHSSLNDVHSVSASLKATAAWSVGPEAQEASSTNANGCVSRSDCSDRGDCMNGKCYCDDLAYGPFCENYALCRSREDCNQHGNCLNGKCQCDDGWIGDQCSEDDGDHCKLACTHDSLPDAACTHCVCLGAWSGNLCDSWDDAVPLDKLQEAISSFSIQSTTDMSALAANPTPPLPGQIGRGVDATTGELKLAVARLSYDWGDVTKQYTGPSGKTYVTAAETTFEELPAGKTTSNTILKSLSEYLSHFSETRGTRSGVGGGILSKQLSPADAHAQFFMGGHRLVVKQQFVPLFEMALPYNSGSVRKYELDPHARRALASLPDTCTTDTHKGLYKLFVKEWGTSYTTKATLGGIAEVAAKVKTCAANTDAELESGASAELNHLLDSTKPGATAAKFVKYRQLPSIRVVGGSPEAAGNVGAWLESLRDFPVELQYTYSSVAELVEDPAKRRCLQQTSGEYIKEQTNSERVKKALADAAIADQKATLASMRVIVTPHSCEAQQPKASYKDMKPGQGVSAMTCLGKLSGGGGIIDILRGRTRRFECARKADGTLQAVSHKANPNRHPFPFPKPPHPQPEWVDLPGPVVKAVPNQCSKSENLTCCFECTPFTR